MAVSEVLSKMEQLSQSHTEPAGGLQPSQNRPAYPVRHAVLTGGEPMLAADLGALTNQLRQGGWHITVETAGTHYQSISCDLMSISPKLSSSTPSLEQLAGRVEASWSGKHQRNRYRPQVLGRLMDEFAYQLKFVIDRFEDLLEVQNYLQALPAVDPGRVLLMPQGTSPRELAQRAAWLQPYCQEHHFHFCPRQQIQWFGHKRGT